MTAVLSDAEQLMAEVERNGGTPELRETVEELVASLDDPAAAAGGNRVGLLSIDMGFGYIGGREVHIREPSMCEGFAKAWVYYNRNRGKVVLFALFKGLPHQLDLCYDYDPSNAQNQYPLYVEDGAWQIWFAGRYLTRSSCPIRSPRAARARGSRRRVDDAMRPVVGTLLPRRAVIR